MSTLKFAYRHLPVIARVGYGSYTYTFIIENESSVKRYEIFADTMELALSYTPMITGYPYICIQPVDDTTYQIFLASNMFTRRCYIYID